MKGFIFIALGFLINLSANASYRGAQQIYQQGDIARYPQLVNELINEKMYFSATPFLKEYLATTTKTNEAALENILDNLI